MRMHTVAIAISWAMCLLILAWSIHRIVEYGHSMGLVVLIGMGQKFILIQMMVKYTGVQGKQVNHSINGRIFRILLNQKLSV